MGLWDWPQIMYSTPIAGWFPIFMCIIWRWAICRKHDSLKTDKTQVGNVRLVISRSLVHTLPYGYSQCPFHPSRSSPNCPAPTCSASWSWHPAVNAGSFPWSHHQAWCMMVRVTGENLIGDQYYILFQGETSLGWQWWRLHDGSWWFMLEDSWWSDESAITVKAEKLRLLQDHCARLFGLWIWYRYRVTECCRILLSFGTSSILNNSYEPPLKHIENVSIITTTVYGQSLFSVPSH